MKLVYAHALVLISLAFPHSHPRKNFRKILCCICVSVVRAPKLFLNSSCDLRLYVV